MIALLPTWTDVLGFALIVGTPLVIALLVMLVGTLGGPGTRARESTLTITDDRGNTTHQTEI